MLTVEQVKAHSEIMVRGGTLLQPIKLIGYKARMSYLKDGRICRLSIVDDFSPPITSLEKAIRELEENEVKSLIPESKWEAFTQFINDNETLSEDMLLSWQEVSAYQKSHPGNNLGTYKMLRYGEIEDIDVQANIKAIYDLAREACN